MELDESLARRLGLRFRLVGSGCLISAEDAPAFLDGCQKSGLQVLGIEGFRIQGDLRIPDMKAIADFSSPRGPYSVGDSIRDAMRFVLSVSSPGLMFEFDIDATTR